MLLHAYLTTLSVTHVLCVRTSGNTQTISGGTETNPEKCQLACLLVHSKPRALP